MKPLCDFFTSFGLNLVALVLCFISSGSAQPAANTPVERITEGIQALYFFQEGEGSVVSDVSGVGEPLNLDIANVGRVRWVRGGGLEITQPTFVHTSSPATKLIEACQATDEITLEAWIRPATINQNGPARIITLSQTRTESAALLGQTSNTSNYEYLTRFNTSGNNSYGAPAFTIQEPYEELQIQHVVFTHAADGTEKIYIDGQEVASQTRMGTTSSWRNDYQLGLANEVGGDRPWLGTYYMAAIYDQALSPQQVQQNYQAASLGSELVQRAPDFQWATKIEEFDFELDWYGYELADFDLATDESGNTYVSGYFEYRETVGEFDNIYFLAKYDTYGHLLWAKQLGAEGVTQDVLFHVSDVAIDSQNHIYLTGYYDDILLDGQNFSSTNYTFFLAKFDEEGGLLWFQDGKLEGSLSNFELNARGDKIALDKDGHVYVNGFFRGSDITLDGTAVSQQSGNMFLAKYNSTGEVLWAQAGGNFSEDNYFTHALDGLQVGATQNIYITGAFQGNVRFGGISFSTRENTSEQDGFLAKYNSGGGLMWAEEIENDGALRIHDLAVDKQDNLYILSDYAEGGGSLLGINLNSRDFLVKYNSQGEPTWVHPFTYQYFTRGERDGALTFQNDHLYVAYNFQGIAAVGNVVFNSLDEGLIFNNPEDVDAIISKLDIDGKSIWTKQLSALRFAWFTKVNAIEVIGDNNLRISGFARTIPLDDGRSAPASGPFVAMLSQEPPLPKRVTESLQVLYTFQEGSGKVIKDVSGVGTPLNLTIGDESAVTWLGNGVLRIDQPTMIESNKRAKKLIQACKQTNEVTIEAWIKTSDPELGGPARIATLSRNTSQRAFTLGQEPGSGDAFTYIARLNTTENNENGIPSLSADIDEILDDYSQLQHIVFTHAADGSERLYVNGLGGVRGTRSGDFSSWRSDYHFALANEIGGERPWLGDYHLVAVYNQALSPAQVLQNYKAGIDSPLLSSAPDWQWVSEDLDDAASTRVLATDVQGNSYTVESLTDFATIAKYDALGSRLWSRGFSSGIVSIVDAVTDSQGHLYLAGSFDFICFGDSCFTSQFWEEDAFIAKFDTEGSLMWFRLGESNGLSRTFASGSALAIDHQDRLYLSGSFNGSFIRFGDFTLDTGNRFQVQFDSDGTALWAKSFSSNDVAEINAATADTNGNNYLAGTLRGTITIGGDTYSTATGNDFDSFIIQFDASGSLIKTHIIDNDQRVEIFDIDHDDQGSIYVTGSWEGMGELAQTPLNTGLFVAKLMKDATSESISWAKQWFEGSTTAPSLVTDAAGNSYVTATFTDQTQVGAVMLTSKGKEDIIVSKFDSKGALRWIKTAGGTGSDAPVDISVLAEDQLRLTGRAAFGVGATFDDIEQDGFFLASLGYNSPAFTSPAASLENIAIAEAILPAQDSLKIYPNPVISSVTLELSEEFTTGVLEVRLYDHLGFPVYNHQYSLPIPQSEIAIPMDRFLPGMYVLKVAHNGYPRSDIRLVKR
ncbi:MAG: LamG-like jellyroll fold domain-containing protein [Bacteroidota bacterium]